MVFFKRWICGTRYFFTPGSLVPGTTDIFSMPVSVPGTVSVSVKRHISISYGGSSHAMAVCCQRLQQRYLVVYLPICGGTDTCRYGLEWIPVGMG